MRHRVRQVQEEGPPLARLPLTNSTRAPSPSGSGSSDPVQVETVSPSIRAAAPGPRATPDGSATCRWCSRAVPSSKLRVGRDAGWWPIHFEQRGRVARTAAAPRVVSSGWSPRLGRPERPAIEPDDVAAGQEEAREAEQTGWDVEGEARALLREGVEASASGLAVARQAPPDPRRSRPRWAAARCRSAGSPRAAPHPATYPAVSRRPSASAPHRVAPRTRAPPRGLSSTWRTGPARRCALGRDACRTRHHRARPRGPPLPDRPPRRPSSRRSSLQKERGPRCAPRCRAGCPACAKCA